MWWLLAFGLALLLLAALWRYSGLHHWADPEQLAAASEPWRHAWYALPMTICVFVIAELVLFPVTVLIFACGLVFGPWLGALHALTGAVASALLPFAIGRRLGPHTVEKHGGAAARRLHRALDRKGIIAVFLVRKVPAPFTLVNIVCGASSVGWIDFVLGTLLGMGTGVILITVLGGQLVEIARDPQPSRLAFAIGLLMAPLVLALLVQWLVNHRRGATS